MPDIIRIETRGYGPENPVEKLTIHVDASYIAAIERFYLPAPVQSLTFKDPPVGWTKVILDGCDSLDPFVQTDDEHNELVQAWRRVVQP